MADPAPPRTAGETVVVTAADEAFAAPGALALLSAATSLPEPPPCLFLGVGLAPATVARIERVFAAVRISLEVVDVDSGSLRGVALPPGLPEAAYARLDLASAARKIAPRSLYVDADTLTTTSLAALLDVDLGGAPFAAVRDSAIPSVSHRLGVGGWQRLGLSPDAPVFNSGVMLADNRLWAEEGVGRRALAELREHPGDTTTWDQGALNAVGAGRWLELDARWNVQVRNSFELPIGSRSLARGGLRPTIPGGILHFTGRIKPWHRGYPPNPARRLYLQAWRLLLAEAFTEPPSLGVAAWVVERSSGRLPERAVKPVRR